MIDPCLRKRCITKLKIDSICWTTKSINNGNIKSHASMCTIIYLFCIFETINEQIPKGNQKDRDISSLWWQNEDSNTTQRPPRKEMSHEYIVKQSEEICKCLNQLRFRKILSDIYMEHIDSGERVFFLIQPDNLSVLSPEVIRSRVRSLTMLLSTQPTLEILALDSRESFQRNKEYYLRRLEEETEPAVRELLERDMAHLDAIQFSSASSRKFVLVIPLTEKMNAEETTLRQLEKTICDHGLRVRLAEEQDVKRLLAIYYRQDLTTEVFRDFDGEEYVHG